MGSLRGFSIKLQTHSVPPLLSDNHMLSFVCSSQGEVLAHWKQGARRGLRRLLLPPEPQPGGGAAPAALLRPAWVSHLGVQLQRRGPEHPPVQTAASLPPAAPHQLQVAALSRLFVCSVEDHDLKNQWLLFFPPLQK